MAVIKVSIFIYAPAEKIYDFAARHPERLPEWFAGVEAVDPDENFAEGSGTAKFTYKSSGMTFKTKATILEAIPGEKWVAKYEGMANGVQTWTYTPEDEGTRVAIHFDYQLVGGGLGWLANKIFVEKQNIKNFEESLSNLKKMMESE